MSEQKISKLEAQAMKKALSDIPKMSVRALEGQLKSERAPAWYKSALKAEAVKRGLIEVKEEKGEEPEAPSEENAEA